jgi:hypothetical protein
MRPRLPLTIPLVLLALAACRDPDAPRPVNELESPPAGSAPLRPLTTRDEGVTDTRPVATRPLPPGLPDPSEPDIPDLARLARYVFREMRMAEQECPFVNPFHDPISFAFHVEVRDGRMSTVHLAWAALRAGEESRPLQPAPPELTAYAACLAPRLEAVAMDPSPSDGAYQPEYSYPGYPRAQ